MNSLEILINSSHLTEAVDGGSIPPEHVDGSGLPMDGALGKNHENHHVLWGFPTPKLLLGSVKTSISDSQDKGPSALGRLAVTSFGAGKVYLSVIDFCGVQDVVILC